MADDAAKVVMARYNHAKSTYTSLFLRTTRWYDIFRGWTTGTWQAYRNNITIPLLFSTVWSDVARKLNVSFGSFPYIQMLGYGPEDAPIARKNELLISAQMKDCSTLMKAADMFLCGDLYGTAVCQTGWLKRQERLLTRGVDVSPSGKRGEKIQTEWRTLFNGPNFEPFDLIDFFPQPGFRTIDEMTWVIRRYYMDLDEIEKASKPLDDGDVPLFDAEAVSKLKQGSVPTGMERDIEQRRNLIRSPFSDSEARRMEKYSKPVEIIEMWGTLPSEFMTEGMATQRVVSVANGNIILRNRPNPFWDGKKPFLAFSPLRDPHFFHGFGKVEMGEKLQLTVNRIANQKLDALDLFIDPVFAYDRTANVETRNLYMRAGKLVGMDGPPGDKIMPISPDLRGLQGAYQEIEDLWRWLQQTNAITSDAVETQSSARTTAREFLSRQENLSTRLLLESRFAEEMWLEPLGNRFRSLNRQFLPVPLERKIVGSNIVDPVTGAPLPPEQLVVDLEDINADYDARAKGTTYTIGKAARQQNMTLLLQAVSSNPLLLQATNWQAFGRELYKAFEMDNIDELLRPIQQQVMEMTQQMGQMGGLPGMPNQIQGPAGMTPTVEEGLIGTMEGTLSGQ